MSKKMTFTLEIEGFDLPEKHKAEISKALNDTLLHKLGELDLAGDGANAKAAGNPLFFSKYLINGGRLLKVISSQLTSAITEIERTHQIPQEGGFSLQTL